MEKKNIASAEQIARYEDPLTAFMRERVQRKAKNHFVSANDAPEPVIPDWVQCGKDYTPPVILAREQRAMIRKTRGLR